MTQIGSLLESDLPSGMILDFLLNATLATSVVALLALTVVLVLRQSSASCRHLVLVLSLVVIVASPLIGLLLPVGLLPSGLTVEQLEDASAVSLTRTNVESREKPLPESRVEPRQTVPEENRSQRRFTQELLEAPQSRVVSQKTGSVVGQEVTEIDAGERQRGGMTGRWAMGFVCAWAAGAAIVLMRVLLGQFGLVRMRKSARLVEHLPTVETWRNARIKSGVARRVNLIESAGCSMPMTCGVLAPTIMLPESAREWPADRLRMVLLHELAHVRRSDCLWQWLSVFISAGQWFNPLVWVLVSRMKYEREQACDDAVLNAGVRATDYATTLLDISTGYSRNAFTLCVGIAMAQARHLSARVHAIVDEERNRKAVSVGVTVCLTLTAAVLLLPASLVARTELETAPGKSTLQQAGPAESDTAKGKGEPRAGEKAQRLAAGPKKQTSQRRRLAHILLPGGHWLRRSVEHNLLADAALNLLASTKNEVKYNGQRDSSVTILFQPRTEIPFTFGNAGGDKSQNAVIGRLYVDVSNPYGPDWIVAEIGGKYRSFTGTSTEAWMAFRREYDRITYERPRPIIPATGKWSRPVNGLQARLAVENWRDPMIAVYLEMKNVRDLVNPMRLPVDTETMQFDFRDKEGTSVPNPGFPRSGPVAFLRDFDLPFDSSMRVNLSVTTVGLDSTSNAMIPLRSHAWVIKEGDFGRYELSALLRVEQDKKNKDNSWHGELRVPPVAVQPASRARREDKVTVRVYDVHSVHRRSVLDVLARLFEDADEVHVKAGKESGEVEVRCRESRHVFVSRVIDGISVGVTSQESASQRWKLRRHQFRQNHFTFVRLKHWSAAGKRFRGERWATDYPDADRAFSRRLAAWTSLDVFPDGKVLEITDKSLRSHSFAYLSEPGSMVLSDEEVLALRNYLTSGGFLMADDFWGEAEWQNLRAQMKRVFPDIEPVDLPLSHRIFDAAIDLNEKPQVCSVAAAIAGRESGITWERPDGKQVHYWGLTDRKTGRLLAVLCHNTDLADGWERGKDSLWYAREFSEKRAFPMGLNIVVFALTQ